MAFLPLTKLFINMPVLGTANQKLPTVLTVKTQALTSSLKLMEKMLKLHLTIYLKFNVKNL